MANCFQAADILLPSHIALKKWACVACDQFSSQPEYWDNVAEFVGDEPSISKMILPEAYLETCNRSEKIGSIHKTMEEYLSRKFLQNYRKSFVYVRRTLKSGAIREGLVGQIDLEAYNYEPGADAYVKATELTVHERIPPRMEVIMDAPLEFSHTILLCDDREDVIMDAARSLAEESIYSFDLMCDGGHIEGRLIRGLGVSIVNAAVSKYIQTVSEGKNLSECCVFGVGDGNHSLASAKACWDRIKQNLDEEEKLTHPARFAMVELENLCSGAITFEPIHRILKNVDAADFRAKLQPYLTTSGHAVTLMIGGQRETVYLSKAENPLCLGILQPFLDSYVEDSGCEIDYIHGEDALRELCKEENTVGILLRSIDKTMMFEGVVHNGVLPRKTFSMGHAEEKRYYLEGKMRR